MGGCSLWLNVFVRYFLDEQGERTDELEQQIETVAELAVPDFNCDGVAVDGYCYVIHNQRYGMELANVTCQEKESRLARFRTRRQYERVLDYVRSSNIITDRAIVYVWTGYRSRVSIACLINDFKIRLFHYQKVKFCWENASKMRYSRRFPDQDLII